MADRSFYQDKTAHVSFYLNQDLYKWLQIESARRGMNYSNFLTYCIVEEKRRAERRGDTLD